MACQKYCKIPIVGDGNCLLRAISFCIYGSEDFHAEIREKVILNIRTRWGLLRELTILKKVAVYIEYEIHYGFIVCYTDLHAVFKTKNINERVVSVGHIPDAVAYLLPVESVLGPVMTIKQ
ncbi:hypothetical protein AVEN_118571-1 [Araneus ventricosus]|uniref:OTU domain-containing protein n=1 Tax=Araneus ventricosus TaxID=182803 RepID=A0A4Y2AWQ6_ARAVE|nr:hypothetical protein AVEN_118571-1 [Araneus ventricosus]